MCSVVEDALTDGASPFAARDTEPEVARLVERLRALAVEDQVGHRQFAVARAVQQLSDAPSQQPSASPLPLVQEGHDRLHQSGIGLQVPAVQSDVMVGEKRLARLKRGDNEVPNGPGRVLKRDPLTQVEGQLTQGSLHRGRSVTSGEAPDRGALIPVFRLIHPRAV